MSAFVREFLIQVIQIIYIYSNIWVISHPRVVGHLLNFTHNVQDCKYIYICKLFKSISLDETRTKSHTEISNTWKYITGLTYTK